MSPTTTEPTPRAAPATAGPTSGQHDVEAAGVPGLTFAELGVPADVARDLERRGIAAPFPIQAATLPDALAGRDVCGRAPTGSGKTIAFGIPLVTRVGKARSRRPRGLVLVPTRELAAQVRDELRHLTGVRGRSVVALYGGVAYGRQVDALRSGVDIVVACPGRLADLVARGEVILDEVDVVVVDEADRMADMGFLPEVTRLLDRTRDDRQTLLFSATLDGAVDVLIRRYQRNPARHELVGRTDEPRNRHLFWHTERADRLTWAADVVMAEWPAIVFCRTKRGADRVAKQLVRAGVSAAAIHGDRSQAQRERALADFTKGSVQALVATDIAARGIHVDGVTCVVHFDPPADEKDYVHRSGRTGRAGASGVVVSLVEPEKAALVRTLQRKLGLPTELDAPSVAALGSGGVRVPPATPGADASGGERPQSPGTRPGAGRRPRPRGRGRDGRPGAPAR